MRVVFDEEQRRTMLARIEDVLASGALTQGKQVARFEAGVAPILGKRALAVSGGTAALEIALSIVGVRGGTVLVPGNTFFATAATAERLGATVDFVDLELDGLGMDPDSLRERLQAHRDVRAVIVVHLAGVISPAITGVLDECRQRGIAVIEDAAHAFGAEIGGVTAGSFGRLAAFSLYPTKVLTSVEGGILTARDDTDFNLADTLRDHGRTEQANRHAWLGANWRMSELHAAVGSVLVERFAASQEQRTEQAKFYDERIIGLSRLTRYRPPAGVRSNHYKYVCLLKPEVDRNALRRRLADKYGVGLAGEVYDIPLHEQPYFRGRQSPGRYLRQAEWFCRHHICLPIYPGLTRFDQERVVEALWGELA
ncbi:DegT/DnrJ/EryC1/StrS family aminotransferase [Streptomyces violascens]|uniref:DegT/DnrJ/EryC1/StrS family aminotransferase n=1 Tax=Streptomyces violascens TaxID=67381 RepID=UPI0036AF9454